VTGPTARARTPGASTSIGTIYVRPVVLSSTLDLCSHSILVRALTRTRDEAVANSSRGNGNLRPESLGETRQELPLSFADRLLRPVLGEASYGNVVLSCGGGNHVSSGGLPGGGRSPDEPVCARANSRWQGKESGIFRVRALFAWSRSLNHAAFPDVGPALPFVRESGILGQRNGKL
jgi:hypothetical protein